MEPLNNKDRRLDRRLEFDERSRKFPIRAIMDRKKPRSYTWRCRANLDQQSEGACVGFSVAHEAVARPIEIQGITDEIARSIYKRAQQLDEWEGDDYEGTSVLAGIKAGQEKGWYPEYRWAFGIEDLQIALSWHGPSVLGINWYEHMMEPDSKGLIHPTGELFGGHAILCNGINVRTKLFRLHNSWGSGWGVKGDCFISFDDLDKLLHEYGEAVIPVLRAHGPVQEPTQTQEIK